MHHFADVTEKPEPEQETDDNAEPQRVKTGMLDRADQKLTNFIGALFSVGSFLCLVGLGILALFFVSIVAEDGEIGMLPIFCGLGLSLIFGMLLLEFTQARALAGYRAARERNARRSRAIASGFLCVLLGMIHPVMALAIPISAAAGCLGHFVINRIARNEPLWDFLPKEATAVLSGRDRIGFHMATSQPRSHVMAKPVTQGGTALCIMIAMASGSYLVAENIMNMAAFIPLLIGSLWASQAILDYFEGRFVRRDVALIPAAKVEHTGVNPDDEENPGLNITELSIRDVTGKMIMTDVSLHVEPGQITGVVGPSGAGKSLLLQAIVDPFSLSDLEVSGHVHVNQTDLWQRQSTEQNVPAVLLPPNPIMMAASGHENLSCFKEGELLTRGKWFLERLVFSVDMVEDICEAKNAQTLPSMQIKLLALARAFLLSPPLYLMDRPEDSLPDKHVSALIHRLSQEARMGRSILMVTNNRALLDVCDKLVVMLNGRIVDYGPATEVRNRSDTGWTRFIGNRIPETEEILVNWVRSHFYRDGDEANRRKVSQVTSDMLAYSCQSADVRNPGKVQFLFKHFEGHCLVRMLDDDPPVGTSALQKARTEAAKDTDAHKLSLLGSVIRASQKVECASNKDNRQISAEVETYDPRKTRGAANA